MAPGTDATSRSRTWIPTVRITLAIVLLGTTLVSAMGGAAFGTDSTASLPSASANGARHACLRSHSPTRHASCGAIVFSNASSATPSGGLTPSDFASAYGLPTGTTAGAGQRIYIVDAYDDTTAAADLNAYRAQFNLPPCTTSNGCFQKVNQNLQPSPLPAAASTGGWDVEEALDLDMVSAACPNCGITLVEANSDTGDLDIAVANAVAAGAKFLSLSWGATSDYDDPAYDNHPGVAYFAASGDAGWTGYSSSPASNPNVISVGGTDLTRNSSGRGWSETVWSDPANNAGTGSACSTLFSTPAWQASAITGSGCHTRASVDVSAHASGAAVYSHGGWLDIGGTSEATPLVAAMAALSGPPPAAVAPYSRLLYAHRSLFNDVTSGNNDVNTTTTPCPITEHLLCYAQAGWDGPTGVGTPNGSTFAKAAPVFASPNSMTSTINQPSTTAVVASGFPLPTITASGTLPPGVHLSDNGDGTGALTGTPTAGGTYQFTLTATNALGSVSQTFTQSVQASLQPVQNGPTFTSNAALTGRMGQPTSFTITTSGSPAATISASGSLPPGVTLTDNRDGTASLSGTPALAGTYAFTLSATNASATATQAFVATIQSTLATNGAVWAIRQNTAARMQLAATGGTGPYVFSRTTSLPVGIALTSSGAITAMVHGTATAASVVTLGYQVVDASGTTTTGSVRITINPGLPRWLTAGALARVARGHSYKVAIRVGSGWGADTFVRTAGTLPPGLTLVPTPGHQYAYIAGRARSAGTFRFTVRARDARGEIIVRAFQITVR